MYLDSAKLCAALSVVAEQFPRACSLEELPLGAQAFLGQSILTDSSLEAYTRLRLLGEAFTQAASDVDHDEFLERLVQDDPFGRAAGFAQLCGKVAWVVERQIGDHLVELGLLRRAPSNPLAALYRHAKTRIQ